jgi:DNA-binding NarL/FixJ family response regulator
MRVFIVDAHPVFREGLKSIMSLTRDLTVIGEADTYRESLDRIGNECDLVILDGELDSLGILQALEKKRPRGRPPFTLILTRHNEEQHAIQLLAAGADGYVNKSKPPQLILDAVRKSDREYQVLYLFASGLGMKEIAGQLSLSVKTISTYRCRLLEKLNLKSNAQLMRYAFKEGVIS